MSSKVTAAAGFAVSLLLALSSLLGCTHFISRGTELYYQGRYVEAAQVFEMTERRLVHATPQERARYGLFRGATFVRLGDLTAAQRWLGYGRGWAGRGGAELGVAERRLLVHTWDELMSRQLAEVRASK